jgi:hypothetical protein
MILAGHSLTDSMAAIDVTGLSDEALGPAVEERLAQLLLQNEPKLTITVDKGAAGKSQRGILIPSLKECVFD